MRINNLIARFLVNKATKEEWEQLETWKKESQDNLAELKDMQSIWQDSLDLKEYKNFNRNRAWDSIDNLISEEESNEVRKPIQLYLKWVGAAAAAIIILIVAFISINIIESDDFYSVYSENKVQELHLPDGSEIVLNKKSTIKYASNFNTERTVEMDGDVFFDVIRDENHEFSVSTDCANIKVLGTSFNIKEEGKLVSVFVKSGSVKVQSGEDEVIIEKNQMVTCDCSSIKKVQYPGVNYLSWKTNRLEFDDTPLHSAVKDISRHFEVNLGFDKESLAMNIKISDTFVDQSLESVLESIALITGINYLKQGNKYIIQ